MILPIVGSFWSLLSFLFLLLSLIFVYDCWQYTDCSMSESTKIIPNKLSKLTYYLFDNYNDQLECETCRHCWSKDGTAFSKDQAGTKDGMYYRYFRCKGKEKENALHFILMKTFLLSRLVNWVPSEWNRFVNDSTPSIQINPNLNENMTVLLLALLQTINDSQSTLFLSETLLRQSFLQTPPFLSTIGVSLKYLFQQNLLHHSLTYCKKKYTS